jgi:hypothetical protein
MVISDDSGPVARKDGTAHPSAGSLTVTVVPAPSSLVKAMSPLCASRMPLQMERPRPVPRPGGRGR